MFGAELNKAVLLTELGYRRDEEVIGKKIDCIYKLGRDPNPVLGSVNLYCASGERESTPEATLLTCQQVR